MKFKHLLTVFLIILAYEARAQILELNQCYDYRIILSNTISQKLKDEYTKYQTGHIDYKSYDDYRTVLTLFYSEHIDKNLRYLNYNDPDKCEVAFRQYKEFLVKI